jgi:hypothetical protein
MASVRDGIYAGCFAGRPVKRLAQNALTVLMLAGATPDGLEAAGYPEDVVEQLRGALVERLVKVRDMLCPCIKARSDGWLGSTLPLCIRTLTSGAAVIAGGSCSAEKGRQALCCGAPRGGGG